MPSIFSTKRQRSTSQPASAQENTAMINDIDPSSPSSPFTPASPSPHRNRANSGSVISPLPVQPSPPTHPLHPQNTYAPLNLSDMDVDFSQHNPYHSPVTDHDDLPPPRPFFLSQSQSRGSWSSYDSYSSADVPSSTPPSDSESQNVPAVVNTELISTNTRSASGAVARRKMTNNGYTALPPGAAAPRRESTVEGYAGIGSGNTTVAAPPAIRSPSPLSASHIPGATSVLERDNGPGTNATATPTPTRPPSAPPVSSPQSRLTAHQRNHSRGNIPPPSSFRASSELVQPTPLNPPKDFTPRPYDGPVNPDPIPSVRRRSNSHASSLKKTSAESLNGTSSNPASVNAHAVDPQYMQQQMAYPPQQYAQMGQQHPSFPMPIPPFARPGAYTYGHNAYLANSAIARASAISAASSNVNIANGMQMMGPGNMIYPNLMGIQSMHSLNAMPGNMTPVVPNGEESQLEHTNGQNSAPANVRDSAEYGFPQESGTPPPIINTGGALPRSPSHIREPFLSPSSRVSSSVWHPPPPVSSYSPASWYGYPVNSINYGYPSSQMNAEGVITNGGTTPINNGLIIPSRKEPLPSSALRRKMSKSEKPWLKRPTASDRWAWWTTFLLIWVGIGAAAVVCFFGYRSVPQLGRTCLVFQEDFNSLDTNIWTFEGNLGGEGNGEFEMYTDSSTNTFTQDGNLYIYPTLTSDSIGTDAIFDGYTYTIKDCTTTNLTACSVTSDNTTGTVINPVMSGRISTINSHSIKYGMVEVRAKLPTGDWLWPAIWMLPKNNVYGEWPLSGEIDIMEARGNGIEYPAQGSNFVRSSLAFGPLAQLTKFVFGWQSNKRVSYADDFHLYRLEWNDKFIRMSVDERTLAMLSFQFTSPFFQRGGFPEVVQNGSVESVVQNPWTNASSTNAAPFDQEFYLLLNVAAGSTSGFFPDDVGGKPWHDAAADAMTIFAQNQDTWYKTWPTDKNQRSLMVDYVKMYELC